MNPNLQDLIDRCSGKYVPRSALDLVGNDTTPQGAGARAAALHLERVVQQAKAANNAAIKILMNGAPGIGKTALALYLQSLLGCNQWSTLKRNGTQVKIDSLEEIERSLRYRSLFGEYRMLHIDEADEIPRVAQVRFLSILDDLPDGIAVVCTSNCKISDFEARFQSRFQVFDIIPPSAAEIEALLADYVDGQSARQIATFACGNVRSALLDAKGLRQNTQPVLV